MKSITLKFVLQARVQNTCVQRKKDEKNVAHKYMTILLIEEIEEIEEEEEEEEEEE
jgi:hypothetical protein